MHDVMQPQAASSLLTAQAPPPPFCSATLTRSWTRCSGSWPRTGSLSDGPAGLAGGSGQPPQRPQHRL